MFWMQFRRMPAWLGEAFDASRPEAQVYPFIFWFAFAFLLCQSASRIAA